MKTDKGLTILFGKDFKDDVKITKMEEGKEGDNIIGSSDDAAKKDSKEPQKFVEGSDDKPKEGDTKTTKKKKKKKKPKKVEDDQVEVPLDNQYEGDEIA